MRLIVLGYVFSLDFSNAPKGDEIGVKRQRRDNNVRQTTRMTYGETPTGVLAFEPSGVYLQDWFESYEGKVGEAPHGFDGKTPANDGWHASDYEIDRGTVTLHMNDGAQIPVRIMGQTARLLEPDALDLDRADVGYLLETARALAS